MYLPILKLMGVGAQQTYAFVLILYRLYVKFVTFLYLYYVIKYV